MRQTGCHNDACENAYAPYFDFEADDAPVAACPICGEGMSVSTLDELAALQADKQARLEAEAAANPPAPEPTAAPEPVAADQLVEHLTALGDKPITGLQLLAILRPDPEHA